MIATSGAIGLFTSGQLLLWLWQKFQWQINLHLLTRGGILWTTDFKDLPTGHDLKIFTRLYICWD
jgi:hypothetical protein